MRLTLGCIRRADEQFGMIEKDDRIAVGVSGGKDSLLLLNALALYRKFCKNPFELEAICLGLGYEPFDVSGVQALCDRLEVPFTYRKTDIKEVVFDIRKETNPCAMCAKLRRGALNNLAKEHGCNKVALGHHREDVVETFLMSLFFEGRLHLFAPVTYLSRVDVTVIRPMIYVPEKHIIQLARKLELPIIHNPCPADGYTKRQEMKELCLKLSALVGKDCTATIMQAISNVDQYLLWDKLDRKPMEVVVD